MKINDSVYLLVRGNPCVIDTDEALGAFTNTFDLLRHYADAMAELEELQNKGLYVGAQIYIYRFERNKFCSGNMITVNELGVHFD